MKKRFTFLHNSTLDTENETNREKSEIDEILRLHHLWLVRDKEGKRANLRGANLKLVDLTGADLTGADLTGADLTGADLKYAWIDETNLTGADLEGADLTEAFIKPGTKIIGNVVIMKVEKIHEWCNILEWKCFTDKKYQNDYKILQELYT